MFEHIQKFIYGFTYPKQVAKSVVEQLASARADAISTFGQTLCIYVISYPCNLHDTPLYATRQINMVMLRGRQMDTN